MQRLRLSTNTLCQMCLAKVLRVRSTNMVPAGRHRPTRIPSLLSSTQPFLKERSEVRSIMGRPLLIAPEKASPRCLVDRHSVSENASKTEPAKLLAVFVVDTDEKELTTPYEE